MGAIPSGKPVRWKIADLNRAEYNPRIDLIPGMPEYEALKASLEENGYVDLIVVNKRNGVVVGGHQRLAVIEQEWGVKDILVREVDLDEADEKRLNLALNKTGGKFDTKILMDELQKIQETGYNLENLGVDPMEFEALNSLSTTGKATVTGGVAKTLGEVTDTIPFRFGQYAILFLKPEYEAFIDKLWTRVGNEQKSIEEVLIEELTNG